MIDQVLVGHARIIGVPIFKVNRSTDLFSGHHFCLMKQDLSTIGARLRHARKAKKLTQVTLASRSGVPQSTISELETGEAASIEGDKLIRLCRALEVRPAWLACYAGPEKEHLSQDALDVVGYWESLPEGARNSMKNTLSQLSKLQGEGHGTATASRQPPDSGKSRRS